MIVQNVFIELLRVSLWGGNADVSADFKEWGKVFTLANQQSVLSLIANVILNDLSLFNRMSTNVKEKLRSFVLMNLSNHSILNSTVVQVVNALRNVGVNSVLLKGQGVAINYPIPELRACGDIDIYVGNENYLKSCEVLGSFASWKENSEPLENMKHFDIKIGKVTVEIHRFSEVNASKYYDKLYQKYSDEGLSHRLRVINFAGTEVYTPADDFNAFYIFNHLWHHFMTSGIGLRQFCDWMLFLHKHKEDINLENLEQIINDMNLMRPWQAFGCVLVDVLGFPANEFPFYNSSADNKVDRIMRYVLEEGNFGQGCSLFGNRRGDSYFNKKLMSFILHIKRLSRLFMIFPLHVVRQFWYTLKIGLVTVWKDAFRKKRV